MYLLPPISKLEFPDRVFVYYGTTRRSVHWKRLTRCVSYPDPAMGGFVIDTPIQITGDHGFHTEWVSWYMLELFTVTWGGPSFIPA